MVYVINYDNQPLMPCSNTIARLLLKQGKAKVKRKIPFTIKLTYQANKKNTCYYKIRWKGISYSN